MKKHSSNKPAYFLLLMVAFSSFCSAQHQADNGYMFLCAIRDKAGNMWFANTGKGLYRYDAASGQFSNFTKQDGLNDNYIKSIYADKAGNLWFGTGQGVCFYDGRSFTDITTKKGVCKFDVNCILEDRTGNFWFGMNGYGVCRYDPVSGEITGFTKEHGLGSDAVQCILEDKAGNLWFGERAGGVSRYDPASGRFTSVNGGGCFSNQIMGIIEDRTGNIWFANLYEGLCRYNPLSGEYTHFTEKDGLCGNVVTCIYEDKKGNIWFGSGANQKGIIKTKPGGLCRYDGKSFTSFTSTDGLGNMDVLTIVEDNEGHIWVGTRGGLFRYHSHSGRFISYTHKVNSSK
jgi:ligand-binding sensor domain-containing protein